MLLHANSDIYDTFNNSLDNADVSNVKHGLSLCLVDSWAPNYIF